MEIMALKGKETGEHLDLKAGFKWIINNLPYYDFVALFKVNGMHNGHIFTYAYYIDEKSDTPKTRADYIKYLMYKIYENSKTDGVSFV